jgi:kojibiose phosphorylase
VVVEDAAAGIEAALRAGMLALGLGAPEALPQAHRVLPDLQGQDPRSLVADLETSAAAAHSAADRVKTPSTNLPS